MPKEKESTFDEFVDIVRRLRKECPWDSVQTHESLNACLEDEPREVLEGLDILSESGSGENLCEELGDVLFNVILQSVIAQEEGLFTIEDVISGISSKMKHRHPRIFSPEDSEAAALSWEHLKRQEKGKNSVSKKNK